MVDIHSATAAIRPGKKRRKKKKLQGKNIMSSSAMQAGHNKHFVANEAAYMVSSCFKKG